MEGIGLSLDLKGGRMFLTDLGGSVYSANLDGSNKKDGALRPRKPVRNRLRGVPAAVRSCSPSTLAI